MPDVAIIGAGLAGLSAGYHAQVGNIDYEVYESDSQVGGCCRTLYRDGFYFDYSGHLLHLKNPYFQRLVRDLLGDNLNILNRKAVIYSHGVYTQYPFQANLFGLPAAVTKECLLEFVKSYYGCENLPTGAYRTFQDWITATLGDGIGRHFMFPYNEKLWTVPVSEMTCSWMSEYVPKPSLEEVFDGAFAEQAKGFGYNSTFWYPKQGGIQALCDAFAARIPNISLGERVTSIDLETKTLVFGSGKHVTYNKLITTAGLNRLVEILQGQVPEEVYAASRLLRHNSILIVNLGVNGSNLTDKHWIYLQEKNFAPYRVGVYSNFSDAMAPTGTTSFYVEIGYQQGWTVDKDELVARAVQGMVQMGLIPSLSDILIQDVVDLDCAYVIYDRDHANSRSIIQKFLQQHNIVSIGRYGNWEYSGMEEAMTQGMHSIQS